MTVKIRTSAIPQVTMDVRAGFSLLVVLGATFACDARTLTSSDRADFQILDIGQEGEALIPGKPLKNDNLCAFCEAYTAQAIEYMAQNKTQIEIIGYLHASCSRLHSFERECVTLVEYYAPLFFFELSSIQPEDFCLKVNLCEKQIATSAPLYEDSCGFCRHAVQEAIARLNDPDTQLEIIEELLKACNAMENYVKKCKRMVFEYGPLFIANGAKFLENTDICVKLHACRSPVQDAATLMKEALLSDS